MLRSPTIIVDVSISPFALALHNLMLCFYMHTHLNCCVFLENVPSDNYVIPVFILDNAPCSGIYLSEINTLTPSFAWLLLVWHVLLLSLYRSLYLK